MRGASASICAVFAAAVAALFLATLPPAEAASPAAERLDCAAAARQALREHGGRLLSVRASGGQCVVSILVQRDKARPRKMTIRTDPKK